MRTAVNQAEREAGVTIARLEKENASLRGEVEAHKEAIAKLDVNTARRVALAEEAMADHDKHRHTAVRDAEDAAQQVVRLQEETNAANHRLKQAKSEISRLQAAEHGRLTSVAQLNAGTAMLAKSNQAAEWWKQRAGSAH